MVCVIVELYGVDGNGKNTQICLSLSYLSLDVCDELLLNLTNKKTSNYLSVCRHIK